MFAAILSLNNFFLAIFATFLGAYEQVTMLTVFRSFHCRLGLKHLSLLMTLWAISRGGLHYPRNITPIDCSQPSILSYFYSIVERTDGVAKELDASTKQKTWLGRDWEKIEAVHIFGKKGIPRFSRNGKFPLVERRHKCHNLDDDRSLLRPGAFCSLQQLSSLIHAVVFLKMKCNVSSLKDEQKEAAVHFFLPKHVFTSFGDRLWGKSDTQLRAKSKNKANGVNVVVLIVSPPKNILKEQREEM